MSEFTASPTSFLEQLETNEPRFLEILRRLISEGKHLQNNPEQGSHLTLHLLSSALLSPFIAVGLIPREDAASSHVLEILQPYSKENGGPLEIERVSFVEGRGNVIIKYPGTTDGIVSFVGSHLDVVPADPSQWERDPFTLHIEGETLHGRGTTDCLGHVALLTDLFVTLAEARVPLKTSVVAVFIANEENGSFKGIGVDQLAKEGYLDSLKPGPVYWIDAADSHPCQGTAGNIPWKLEITGRLFHSGMPHQAVNPIEMGHDVMSYIQHKFYQRFPRDERENIYNFTTCSTMKPTQISCTTSSLNQIPPQCTIMGDIRLTPFYDVHDAVKEFEQWVEEINADPQGILAHLSDKGPHSKYSLADGFKGSVKLTILGAENGIAVNMNSPGYHAMLDATSKVLGLVKPYSINGSLPLVRDMQSSGFDIQISGYGLSSKYHANNECAYLGDMKKATRILANIIAILEKNRE